MASKVYVCHKWPALNLGFGRFEDGKYVTDDEKQQEAIEKHEQFGRNIFPVEQTELPEEPAEASVVEPVAEGSSEDDAPVKKGGVHQGSRGTGTIQKKK